jgi:hypothetical protein
MPLGFDRVDGVRSFEFEDFEYLSGGARDSFAREKRNGRDGGGCWRNGESARFRLQMPKGKRPSTAISIRLILRD